MALLHPKLGHFRAARCNEWIACSLLAVIACDSNPDLPPARVPSPVSKPKEVVAPRAAPIECGADTGVWLQPDDTLTVGGPLPTIKVLWLNPRFSAFTVKNVLFQPDSALEAPDWMRGCDDDEALGEQLEKIENRLELKPDAPEVKIAVIGSGRMFGAGRTWPDKRCGRANPPPKEVSSAAGPHIAEPTCGHVTSGGDYVVSGDCEIDSDHGMLVMATLLRIAPPSTRILPIRIANEAQDYTLCDLIASIRQATQRGASIIVHAKNRRKLGAKHKLDTVRALNHVLNLPKNKDLTFVVSTPNLTYKEDLDQRRGFRLLKVDSQKIVAVRAQTLKGAKSKRSVDIAAKNPVCIPPYPFDCGDELVVFAHGSSFSAPQVAGVLAWGLVVANDRMTHDAVRTALLKCCEPNNVEAKKSVTGGVLAPTKFLNEVCRVTQSEHCAPQKEQAAASACQCPSTPMGKPLGKSANP